MTTDNPLPADALPPLTRETLWGILNDAIADETVNQLLWEGLGYRWDGAIGQWDLGNVAADWCETYPEPPDFIESRPATVKLTRSIPPEHKQLLKTELGFKGYPIGELVPRKTRRATAVSWLLAHMRDRGIPL